MCLFTGGLLNNNCLTMHFFILKVIVGVGVVGFVFGVVGAVVAGTWVAGAVLFGFFFVMMFLSCFFGFFVQGCWGYLIL